MSRGKTVFSIVSSVFLLTSVITKTADAALIDGLQLYYSFDNDALESGGIHDVSGNARDGSPLGIGTPLSFSDDVPTVIGGGKSLNASGTQDFIGSDVPGYAGIDGAGDRSVSAWVKSDTDGLYHLVEWGSSAAGQRWSFRVNNNAGNGTLGGLRVEVQGGFIISEAVIADGQWHHVAATFTDDGTPDVEDVLLYVDGTLSNVGPPTTPNPEPINTVLDGNVSVAGSLVFQDRGHDGLMDEVGIWNRVLSGEEISALAAGAVVPEPASMLLLALGMMGVFFLRH